MSRSTPPKANLAAGFRRLGARSHARLLDEQTESLTRVISADERVIAVARMLVDLHHELRAAERSMVAANERASSAVYEAPASTVLVGAAA